MRNKDSYCNICQKYFHSLGFARHRAMHSDELKRMKEHPYFKKLKLENDELRSRLSELRTVLKTNELRALRSDIARIFKELYAMTLTK